MISNRKKPSYIPNPQHFTRMRINIDQDWLWLPFEHRIQIVRKTVLPLRGLQVILNLLLVKLAIRQNAFP
jgi:hypothetical protein